MSVVEIADLFLPSLMQPSSFVINKTARQPSKERHLNSIQGLRIAESAERQVPNQAQIADEKQPADD